jgi:YVTN family beta-propeller protein
MMRGATLGLGILTLVALIAGVGMTGRSADGGMLLVTNKSGNTVSIIDAETGEELKRLATGPAPHEVAATPDGRLAFIANYGHNSLTVVDLGELDVAGTVDLGSHTRPHGIVVTADGKSVWVTTEGSQELVEVDVASRQVKQAIRTGQQVTHMVTLVESLGKAYTANIGSGNVTAIDTRAGEVIKQIATGAGAEGITTTVDDKYVLVTNRQVGTFTVIDPTTDEIVHSIELGGFPIRVEVTPDGARALISQATAETLVEINVGDWTIARSLTIGRFPVGIEIRPDGRVAYVANTRDDMLTVVDLESFKEVGTLEAGEEPDGMAFVSR